MKEVFENAGLRICCEVIFDNRKMKKQNLKKKILIIATSPLANDGLTKIEIDIIQANKSVINFEIACGFGFENEYGKKLKEANIICHNLPAKKNVIAYMYSIKKLVKKNEYDSVYIHGNSAMMFFESFPSKIAGTRVITHCHNTRSDFPLIHYMIKPLFNMLVDEKIGCSSMACKWAYCGGRIKNIINGIDVNTFMFDESKRKSIRHSLEWDENLIIGHIGRFNRQKNHEKLINIFYEMLKISPKCRLLLIGDGELKFEIENKIKCLKLQDYVQIICYTDKPQNYLQAMDVVVMPSRFEGLCLVALEAQANGVPIVLSDKVAPETFSAKNAFCISLDKTDYEWAYVILKELDISRNRNTEYLQNTAYDKKNMMQQLRMVLLDEVETTSNDRIERH